MLHDTSDIANMKTTTTTPSGRALISRTVLPRSLIRKVNAAARAEGIDADAFIARAIAREPYRQPAPMLSDVEAQRLELLSGELRTSPTKALHAIIRNALGFSFYVGNSHQSRVIDLSAEMKWA